MRKVFMIAAAILIAGCGGGSDNQSSKDLFSIWHRDSDGLQLDLRNGAFDTNMRWVQTYTNGAQCACLIRATGTQATGVFVVNQCKYVQGSSVRDPGCSSQNTAGRYTNENAKLTLTSGSSQQTYR